MYVCANVFGPPRAWASAGSRAGAPFRSAVGQCGGGRGVGAIGVTMIRRRVVTTCGAQAVQRLCGVENRKQTKTGKEGQYGEEMANCKRAETV